MLYPTLANLQWLGRGPYTNATRPVPRIPQEVVDLVLDHLHDNKVVLHICSLVSRAWARSTARHLFGLIRWPRCRHWWADQGIQHIICRCEEPGMDGLYAFLKDSVRIRDSLLDLRISFKRVELQSGRTSASVMALRINELFTILEAVPQLRRLELDSFIDIQSSIPGGPRFFRLSNRTLDAIVFRESVVDSEYAAAIVTFFEGISEVSFVRPRTGSIIWNARSRPYQIRPNTDVSVLSIEDSSAISIIACLKAVQSSIHPENLTTLRLGILCSLGDRLQVESLAQRAPSLQSLRFSVVLWLPSYEKFVQEADVRQRIQAGSQSDWSSVVPILNCFRGRNNSLRIVEIGIQLRSHPESPTSVTERHALQCLQALDWSLLDNAVANLMFLETLRLFIWCSGNIDIPTWHRGPMAFLKRQLKPRTWAILQVRMAAETGGVASAVQD